ncbi:hypothetical protein AZE42_10162 [Rhizopogon vesiculosus]|uniref:Uncharacterized protein n=1 Tax=Rhizopogon vesiculosus TaxID=180088 RepID=A0A1J8QE82_9AGAM|nr:hypothetical protein AZE42_10162 [Rhizopogon vesiculosus]
MSPLYCNTVLGCLNARAFITSGIYRDRTLTFQVHLDPTSILHASGAQRPLSIAAETKPNDDTESLVATD